LKTYAQKKEKACNKDRKKEEREPSGYGGSSGEKRTRKDCKEKLSEKG